MRGPSVARIRDFFVYIYDKKSISTYYQKWPKNLKVFTRRLFLCLHHKKKSSISQIQKPSAGAKRTNPYVAVPFSVLERNNSMCCMYYTSSIIHYCDSPCNDLLIYCTVLYFTSLHCTALHCTALHWSLLYCTALF